MLTDLIHWIDLGRNLGAGPAWPAAYPEVTARYAEPHRRYHTLEHIDFCLGLFQEARGKAESPAELEAALWLHDVVYDPRAADNEERSADLAGDLLTRAEVGNPRIALIRRLILATRHRVPPASIDEKLVVDIDLAILGQSPEQFDAYDRSIREEFAWVPPETFRLGRKKVLEGFLIKDPLFHSEMFQARFGDPARANLARALKNLATPG